MAEKSNKVDLNGGEPVMSDKSKWYADRRKGHPKSRNHFTVGEGYDKIFPDPKCIVCGGPVLFIKKDIPCDSCRDME